MKKEKNLVLISIITFLTISILAVAYAIFHSFKSSTLEILVAPESATITLNDKEIKNGIYHLYPGDYEIIIKKENFESKTFNIKLEKNETKKLYTYLLEKDGSYSWYINNRSDALLLNKIGAYESSISSSSYLESYPISKVLPIIYASYDESYNYTEFRIDGGFFDECEKNFCLKISDTTGGNYEAALEKIREKNFNPSDYKIIYVETPIVPLNS